VGTVCVTFQRRAERVDSTGRTVRHAGQTSAWHGGGGPEDSGPDEGPIRVLVVDDHPVVRFGVTALLRTQPDLRVVGETGTCVGACEAVAQTHPDVVILDLELEDACGAEALSRLREVHPHVPVIVFTAHNSGWRVVEAVQIGLQGYVLKGTDADMLCEAVRVVHRGGYFLDPKIASLVMAGVGRREERRRYPVRYVTERERAVLRLLAEGRRNKEIARALDITERTVKYHIGGLLAKLRVSNRTELVKAAVGEGLVNL
jgi:DNA-binding NarL/FixJ family response regulator